MKLGVFAVLFSKMSLEEMLDYVKKSGLNTIEIGTGGYVGNAHCDPKELLADESKLEKFMQAFESRGIEISALSCHGNSLHPNEEIATEHHEAFVNTVKLAAKLGVENVVTFSGCPGESDYSKHPVWITCPWPDDFSTVVEWQWENKVIPYWKKQTELLDEYNVRAAIEPHPGFVVYNTETILRLRSECGEKIGANFDPSHYFWQGMDPVNSIRALGDALFHFHAKDTRIDSQNNSLNGVLDTKSYRDIANRSWVFRTVGYGHGEDVWRDIISALQTIEYQGAVSIEHEDGLMGVNEGFTKAVSFLKDILIEDGAKDLWWA
ncbi:sugar phosphate isomerase/epimerase family protein [Lederbergia lenta]|uniref:Sugar phosphate isomerase/epimerase n=1 Tax=Lederbergia lenta TaxID=1467 RepID=A0A2X4YUL3_LEDLE|nr:sugar phosphate isomerase/epimerase [Lederbergia lenta]MCM3111205.1 sugar phosphate isomerase/epimerase [Lederbergia lenta]MEC2325407.1 sugar phosphate isomerase/epimerase [Lederbergia lenta]SQI55445.1 sugar phosphate isomerase/epimerase [Lederbergia lenta]